MLFTNVKKQPVNLLSDSLTVTPELPIDRGELLKLAAQEALHQRDALSAKCSVITAVPTSQAELDVLGQCGQLCQRYIKFIEESRLLSSRPLDDAKQMLMDLEELLTAPVREHKKRLAGLATQHREREDKRIEEEKRKWAEEVDRLDRERKVAEAEAKQVNGVDKLEAEAGAHNANLVLDKVLRAPLPELVKAKGSATKRTLGYRVTNVDELCKARRELCNIQEKPSAIRAVCVPKEDATEVNRDKSIPGLEMWWKLSTDFRR